MIVRGGETKSAIAKDLGLSRFKVARLIDEAIGRGLVRIEVSMTDSPLDLELSESVRKRYGLRQAVVLAARVVGPDFRRQELGAVASSVLAETVNIEPELRQRISKLGVVADIGASLIDRDGRSIRSPVDSPRLAISGAQLRAVPEVIAVAGGIEKTEAIRAALLGGWVTTLITDGDVASALCK